MNLYLTVNFWLRWARFYDARALRLWRQWERGIGRPELAVKRAATVKAMLADAKCAGYARRKASSLLSC